MAGNRLGFCIFQCCIPGHLRKANPSLGRSFRKSLHTRNRRKALRHAKVLSVMMDELAKQYFHDAAPCARALKLLQEYRSAENLYPTWKQFEEHFLMDLDDREMNLLKRIIAHREAMAMTRPSSRPVPDMAKLETRLQELLQEQTRHMSLENQAIPCHTGRSRMHRQRTILTHP